MKRADALRDGTMLCRYFNNGSCKSNAKDCGYAHRCSATNKNGRVCGGNHAAKDHK